MLPLVSTILFCILYQQCSPFFSVHSTFNVYYFIMYILPFYSIYATFSVYNFNYAQTNNFILNICMSTRCIILGVQFVSIQWLGWVGQAHPSFCYCYTGKISGDLVAQFPGYAWGGLHIITILFFMS